ncbi:hypothetical protein [Rubripirellula reticaptiva]|uniref:Uncharacterized protein n=1 Tax=Rubripirellula reticaptiva TaxID=2528013 RepID=A0A5C6EXT0_9BACT|nr:hypothetical protein [Rubripirellula reticaptiva]TWU52031.1 hypothetical protein Poly59_36280 [Rubripirellula reticaptiva]
MKRHEILERKIGESPDATVARRDREWTKLLRRVEERPDKAELKSSQIQWAVNQAAFDHLGFGPTAELNTVLNSGLDNAISFFSGSWWRECEEDRYFLDKKSEWPVQGWDWPLTNGLLLADWTNRWKASEHLLNWVDEDVARCIRHDVSSLNCCLYLVSLLHQRLSVHDQLASFIDKKGTRFERLLSTANEAISRRDDAVFATAIKSAVKQFHKSEAEDGPDFGSWISLELSLTWSFASRRGMTLPTLDPLGDAIIVRPESIANSAVPGGGKASALSQEHLDSGLITAIAELDYDTFASLLERGASTDVARKWKNDLLGIDDTRKLEPYSARDLIIALRNTFAAIPAEDRMQQITLKIIERARKSLTDDDIEASLDGLCDELQLSRAGDL